VIAPRASWEANGAAAAASAADNAEKKDAEEVLPQICFSIQFDHL